MKRVANTKKSIKTVSKKASIARVRRATPTHTRAVVKVTTKKIVSSQRALETTQRSRMRSPFLARTAALVLISYFLIVPVADVYADTSSVAVAPAASAVATPPTDTTSVASTPAEVPTPAADVPAPISDTSTSVPQVVESTPPQTPTSTPSVLDASSSIPVPRTLPDIPTTVTSATDTASTTVLEVPTQPATTTQPAPVTPTTTVFIATTTAPIVVQQPTTTVADTANQPLVVSHTTDADKMSFSAGECVIIGDGTFQCMHAVATTSNSLHTDGVYSARDSAGVMQVYYQHNGTTDTITHTTYDNDAPALDSANGDIVWHALLNDRYQIMKYEQKTGKTTQLTEGTVNSMLPSSYDGVVVYQTWQGNDWDIVMIDHDGTSRMLTNNDVHDVAPSITDRYVTWQSRENNEWVAKVFDRVSGTTQTVRGTQGGKVENPRMVLVFDSKKENGDIETVGYDVAHNQVVPLSATPAPLPKDIPQPSSQKNDQAFVQSATTTKIEVKVATGTPDGSGGTGTSTPPTGEATSTTLSIPDATTTAATSTDIQATSSLAVPTLEASSTQSAPAIPDLVIEPYNATDTATTSSVQ